MEKNKISFQPHTINHVNLTRVSREKAIVELKKPKAILEEKLKRPKDFIAYPYGSFNDEVVELVKKAGYKAAFTTSHGVNIYGKIDIYRIRRMSIKEKHSGFWGRLLFIVEVKINSLL